jgi:hypothetical protein
MPTPRPWRTTTGACVLLRVLRGEGWHPAKHRRISLHTLPPPPLPPPPPAPLPPLSPTPQPHIPHSTSPAPATAPTLSPHSTSSPPGASPPVSISQPLGQRRCDGGGSRPPLGQRLTLVHFSAQLEPFPAGIFFYTLYYPPHETHSTPPKQPSNAPPVKQNALTLSRKVDECKSLP